MSSISSSQFPGFYTAKFTKADVTAVTAWSTANSPITLFTVTGTVLLRIYGRTSTALTSTGATGTLAIGISGSTTIYLGTTTADGTNFATGSVWIDTSPTIRSEALVAANLVWHLNQAGNAILTIATNNMSAGGMELYCDWIPVSAGATVV